MIKFTIVLRRNLKLKHEQFVDYHQNQHAPLFCSLPEVKQHVRRYVQCHSMEAPLPGLPDSKIDGTTELWFDDLEALASVFESQEYLSKIRPDEEKFLDLHACEFLVAIEHAVLG